LKHGRIELVKGNIVEQKVDALVNAANTTLAGGGGVDGAMHRAAGSALLEECLKLPEDENGKRCPTGDVRVTGAGKLSARWVVHAAGPYYNERSADKARVQLRQVHERALQAAVARGCRTVAFPAISTGAYRFPIADAAAIALAAVREHLRQPQSLEVVRFVLFTQKDLEVFRTALEALS
jgi:O-acetyl-ADP-ribose deacetylase (regulator of RNase III)